eukprot:scaffold158801_cov14-Tisochrysis_lutea.AAC.1
MGRKQFRECTADVDPGHPPTKGPNARQCQSRCEHTASFNNDNGTLLPPAQVEMLGFTECTAPTLNPPWPPHRHTHRHHRPHFSTYLVPDSRQEEHAHSKDRTYQAQGRGKYSIMEVGRL